MKKSLILSAIIFTAALPVTASIDIQESTTPEYLYNSGYSTESIRLIQYNKSYSTNGNMRSLEQNKIRNKSLFTKFMDYIDPGRDDGKFYNRDLQMQSPGYEDL